MTLPLKLLPEENYARCPNGYNIHYLDRGDGPIVVFWGSNDRMMPDSGLLALAKQCPNMRMVVLSECGHWAMVEYESLFNRESLAFLQS